MAGRRKKLENLTLEQQLEAVTNEIAASERRTLQESCGIREEP